MGETVANSLTGNPSFKPGTSPNSVQPVGNHPIDALQKGVVTILDIEVRVQFFYNYYIKSILYFNIFTILIRII